MNLSLTNKLKMGFGFSLAVLLITSLLSYLSKSTLATNTQWVDHTNAVLFKLEHINASVLEAETAQRGFLYSNDHDFLSPYQAACQSAIAEYHDLYTLTQDNHQQQLRLDTLVVLLNKKFDVTDKTIALKKGGKDVEVEALFQSKAGMIAMSNIKYLITTMENTEKALLTARTQKVQQASTRSTIFIICSSLVAILLVICSYLLISKDIQDNLAFERQITNLSNLLSSVVDSSLSGIIALQSIRSTTNAIIDFKCLISNKRGVEILQSPFTDLAGKKLSEIIANDSHTYLFDLFVKAVEENTPIEREIKFDWYSHPMWFHLVVLKMEDGLVATLTDITERKNADKEIREQSQSLTGVLKNIPVVVYRINAEGIMTQSVGEGLKAVGRRDNESAGKHMREIYPEMYERFCQVQQGASDHFIGNGTSNGKEWFFENYIFPDEVTAGGIIGFAFNVTDRIISERASQTAKLNAESANIAKTRFLANMSHEIRTPINAILGFANVLKKGHLSPDQQEYLNYIISSGDTLLKLIGDILDLTKIEEGKLELSEESFHFKEVLASALHPYKFRANEKGLNFELHFDERIPAYLIGDSSKITQMLINLIGNALKFTREGGIALDFSLMENSADVSKALIKVSVTDSGIGVPKDQQDTIFHSFIQADSSISRQYGGSGLGLTIVKELAHLMQTDIHIISPVEKAISTGGHGSTFWFSLSLPINTTQVKELKALSESKEAVDFGGKIKVLIVEDNPVNQKLARLILKEMGCQIAVANNGQEAIMHLQKERADLIFMDIQMPVMDGYEATRILRRQNNTTPIVGLSANVYKEDVDSCYQAGMNDYLGKPYTEEKMRAKVQKWVPAPLKDTALSSSEESKKPHHTNMAFIFNITKGDKEEIRDLIMVFLEMKHEFVASIETYLKSNNHPMIAQAAHKMKSCVNIVGLEALEEPLRTIEQQAKAEQPFPHIESLYKEIKTIFDDSEKELALELLNT